MGYHTEFSGSIKIEPPLGPQSIEFLTKFNETRRMNRRNGPHFVDGTGEMGQGMDPDIIDYNSPPPGQPGLWCQWVPTPDGTAIEWDGGEKFYEATAWMKYIIDHYIAPQGHVCNGEIDASGEDSHDLWLLVVTDNAVTTKQGMVSYA